jgi:hypothetical protein
MGMEYRSDGKLQLSIGMVLTLLSWFTMLCHTLPGFLAEMAQDGYRKEKVAIHEWHLYMQAVEHSPNTRILRMRYAACKYQITGTSKSAGQLRQAFNTHVNLLRHIFLLLLFIASAAY